MNTDSAQRLPTAYPVKERYSWLLDYGTSRFPPGTDSWLERSVNHIVTVCPTLEATMKFSRSLVHDARVAKSPEMG